MNPVQRVMFAIKPPWWSRYRSEFLGGDLIAGLIVALMLIPQGLAYATLAGVPPQYGLYASLLPVVCYAIMGSSSVMSVGPVAITSLLAASALAPLAILDTADYVMAAALLALLSGGFLLMAGVLRLGALAQLLSHPVVTGFISGAAVLIIISQLKPLLGVSADGSNTAATLLALISALPETNGLAAGIGITGLMLLLLSRKNTVPLLVRIGLSGQLARMCQRLVPMLLLLTGALMVYVFDWQSALQVVGVLPSGLPDLSLPEFRTDWIAELWFPALVIGLLGFVESISIAQSFAQKKREPLDANAELRALGAANIGSALVSGFPVTGGFSRTLVNAEAGAHSPLSGVFSAGFVLLALWFATALFAYLPITLLAATIISAAVQLVNATAFRHAWRYDRAEGGAMLGTAAGVILFGVEAGIGTGVALSIITLVWRSSRPHIAIVGRVPDTEHFRNVARHQVVTSPEVLMIRIDESLFFGNAESVLSEINLALSRHGAVKELILVMSSVSHIDVTALEMLLQLDESLQRHGVRLHLSEVKGPVEDKLKESALPEQLSGEIFLTTFQAYQKLTPDASLS